MPKSLFSAIILKTHLFCSKMEELLFQISSLKSVFEKLHFQNDFRPTLKRESSVFKFIYFWRAFSKSSVFGGHSIGITVNGWSYWRKKDAFSNLSGFFWMGLRLRVVPSFSQGQCEWTRTRGRENHLARVTRGRTKKWGAHLIPLGVWWKKKGST